MLPCNTLNGITFLNLVVLWFRTGILYLSVFDIFRTRLTVNITVSRGCLVLEIEQQGRIDALSEKDCFKMKVRSGTATCISAQTDRIASLYILIFGNQLLRKVCIKCFDTIVMAYYHIMAIAATLITRDTYLSVKSCIYRVTGLHLDIKPVVHTAPARTITENVGYLSALCRHDKACQVNAERIWQLGCIMYSSVFPVGIHLHCRHNIRLVQQNVMHRQ